MTQRIIRLEGADPDVTWDEVLDKPEEFPVEPHQHEWGDINNEPDFAPTAHTHSEYAPATHGHSNYAPATHNHEWENITGFRAENPTGFDFNAALNSGFYSVLSAPNAPASGWVNLFIVRHPINTSNNQFQIASPMLQNTDFYIRNLNPAAGLVAWRKLWHDGNFLVQTGAWTPVLTGSTGAGNPSYTGGKRVGRYIRQGLLALLEFHLQGSFTTAPTGDVRISGIPAALVPNTDPDYEFNQLAIAADVGWEVINSPLQYIIKGNTNYIGLYSCGFSALPINWNSRGQTNFLFKGSIRYRL